MSSKIYGGQYCLQNKVWVPCFGTQGTSQWDLSFFNRISLPLPMAAKLASFSIDKFFLTDPNEISCLIPVTKQWWGGEREVSYNLPYSAFPLSAEISLRNYRVPRSTVGEPVVYLMYWTLSFPKQHVISFCQYTLSFQCIIIFRSLEIMFIKLGLCTPHGV